MNQLLPTYYPSERAAGAPPERILISEWADKYRTLPSTSGRPGPWETSFAPYLREMMDAFKDPHVERITLMTSTQVGKSETLNNILGYIIDQDPGQTLYVCPREEDAVGTCTHRVKPMIDLAPVLKRHTSDAKGDWQLKQLVFDRMVLFFAGSNSPSDLASRSVRYLIMDELDKFPAFSGKEADPVSLAVERTRTFWDRKIVLASTPTTRAGYIWREWMQSDRRKFWVPCPFCSTFQTLEFGKTTLRWEEGDAKDPARLKRDRLAWYQCGKCERKIPDDHEHKRRMLAGGKWVPEGGTIDAAGEVRLPGTVESEHRGYHVNALYSPWLTWSEVAAQFLRSKDDYGELLNFYNSWLGLIWEEQAEASEPEAVAKLARPYEIGVIPEGCLLLTAGVDVQKDILYYVVRGHGYREESWLIEWGRVEQWEALESILFRSVWPREKGGGDLRLGLACIDSGYRTDEVYEFCREQGELARPTKGQARIAGIPIRALKIERTYEGKVLGEGAMMLWHVDTSHFKDKMLRLMRLREPDLSLWHLPKEPSDEYLRQVTSEHKIRIRDRLKGTSHDEWKLRPGGGWANHWLDAEIYAMAAAEMLAVYSMQPDEVTAAPTSPRDTSRVPAVQPNAPRPGWISGGRGGIGRRERGGSWIRGER